MEHERFALHCGRNRPPYTPKNIQCPHCGAGFTIKDERSELVVCDYCGSHLNVSREEQEVLGKGASRKWEFPIKLGDSFKYKAARYEIIARMVFIEDDDEDEASRQYLLYNPYHGTLWLDDYQGQYSLSMDTHVMPTEDPFSKRRGDLLKTHDQQAWVLEGTGTYELVYVDGALPWIAQIGDRAEYAEFLNNANPKLQYEAQRIAGEIEYGKGESLSLAQVRQALGKPELAKGERAAERQVNPKNVVSARRGFTFAFVCIALALVVNAAVYMIAASKGRRVLQQQFSAAELTSETLSKPFIVRKNGEIIKIAAIANIDNAWMALDIGLVRPDDDVIRNEDILLHVEDADLSYYYGSEGGESWSEGSQKSSTFIKIPTKGTYKLMVHAVSANGEAETATQAAHSVTIQVYAGTLVPYYSLVMAIISGVMLIGTFMIHSQWKNVEEDD